MNKQDSIKFLEELIIDYQKDIDSGDLSVEMRYFYDGRKSAFELSLELIKSIYLKD